MTDHLAMDRDKCLSDLAYEVSLLLGTPPVSSTAIIEHVFQALIDHFYRHGNAYLPNLGWLYADGGDAEFVPCDAFETTLKKIQNAISSRTFTFANIERVIEAGTDADATKVPEEKQR